MKSAMSAQKIPLRSKIEAGLSILQAHRHRVFLNTDKALTYHRLLLDALAQYVGRPIQGARVLDIGCGQTAMQVALFNADGAVVTGIDIEVPTYAMSLPLFWRTLRLNGPERAVKSLARHVLFDRRFFADLAQAYGRPVPFKGLDTRIMDATRMTFADGSFDLVYSKNVLEHVPDVPALMQEINRVLKPDGLAVITIHPFPCLSGGHAVEWMYPDREPSATVPPWDHLREYRHPANTYLNRYTLRQYRELFATHTEVLVETTAIEGEKLLTPGLECELMAKGYTREDLLTSTLTLIVRHKPS